MAKFSIVYDWCPDWEPGDKWADHDYYDEHDLYEVFEGSWDELQEYLVQMRINGCYHISVYEHENPLEED